MNTHLTPEGFRTAAYLEARARMDLRGKGPKCNPPNRACGDRCIPPNWKCRVKGEGTDSHSRVIAGDPLAGAASIARGRRRLTRGLQQGSITEIQAGRAAIARGVVKAVPGKNLKSKQKLRAKVEGAILPVATGLFAVWALRQTHEATKKIFPVYAKGIGRDIEQSAGNAVGFVLDRIPFYGTERINKRKNAALQAQVLAMGASRASENDPSVFNNNKGVFPTLSESKLRGLSRVINESLDAKQEGKPLKSYTEFRSDLLSNVLDAQNDGKSIYAKPAAIEYLAGQYNIPRDRLLGADGVPEAKYLTDELRNRFTAAQKSMRSDMNVRGLDYKKPDDIESYIEIATNNARSRFRQLTPEVRENAVSAFRGTVRELISPTSEKDGVGPSSLARRMYTQAEESYDIFFKEAARQVKENTDPRINVVAPVSASYHVNSTLRGVANLVRRRVAINTPVSGGNHAELILQKVYHEYATRGKRFNKSSKSTWITSEADIKYAAQDLGWNGTGGIPAATRFLRSNGFPNLAFTPAQQSQQTRRTIGSPRTANPSVTGRARSGRKANYDREKKIQMFMQAGYSREEAEEKVAKLNPRTDANDTGLSVRLQTYLLVRADKACGASYIPDNKKCTKTVEARTSAKSPVQQSQNNVGTNFELTSKHFITGAAVFTGLGLTAVTAAAIDDVVRVRSRQFGEPTFKTFSGTLGDPKAFNAAKTKRLSAGAFGETSFAEVDGKTYVVKNPKMPDKATRAAMAAGLDNSATKNLFRAQGRMTQSEVANARLAAAIGVAPKVVAADRNTLVTEVAAGKPAKKLDKAGKEELHRTLAKLHRAGIAHNDLKPDNFFMDEKGKMQLIDFGLSMRSSSGVAREWYRAMNHNSPNVLLKATGTATGSFNLKELNPRGYANAEKALSQVLGGKVTEERLIEAGKDAKKARQLQLVINNYYLGLYNYMKPKDS